MEQLSARFQDFLAKALAWLTSPQFYAQIGAIIVAVMLAFVIARLIRSRVAVFRSAPEPGPLRALRQFLFAARDLLRPILIVLLLGFAVEIGMASVGQAWLIRVAQSLAVVLLLYTFVSRFIVYAFVRNIVKWIGIPLALLQVFGWLDDVTTYLDGLSIAIGDLQISVYDLGRGIFLGVILFWLGRVSNASGKRAIRSQPNIDVGTREILAKLFEIALFVIISLLVLLIMGIELTALAFLGGALALGLGFGLQRIVANFISGLIILLDRSITLGDYIELGDGRAGTLRELNLRCATLETFDGKDLVVPNDTFVSETFTNWTHKNRQQRYSLTFSVAYDTDLPTMIEIVTDVVTTHPQVLSSPDLPDEERASVEIDSFGDSAINVVVEFWMDGVDDGKNSVCADLNLMIWQALKDHDIEMPFPQREIRMLDNET